MRAPMVLADVEYWPTEPTPDRVDGRREEEDEPGRRDVLAGV